MSILPVNGPLRVRAPVAQVGSEPVINEDETGGAPVPAPPLQGGDDYLKRLVLLIPSEVLALYLTFKEVASSWLGVWAFICLLLVVLVRTVGTRQAGKAIQWPAVIVACVSFVLWIYASGGHLLSFTQPQQMPGAVSVAVGVWTFLVPYLYKGD